MPLRRSDIADEELGLFPTDKSLRDMVGSSYADAAGGFNTENLRDDLRTLAQRLIDGTAGAEAGATLPAGKSLIDVLGTQYVDAGGNPDVDTIREHLTAYIGTGTGTVLAANKSLIDTMMLDIFLDHLQGVTTVGIDMTAEVVDGSVISRILSKTSDTSTYTPVTDSLEMISDKTGAFSGDGGAAQDDSVKASLDLAHTDIDAILADTGTSGVVVNSFTAAANRVAGKSQVIEVALVNAANAGNILVASVTDQPCVIDSLIIHADTAQTANMTTCAVYGGAANVITFIGAGDATQANLNAIDKQVGWTGAVRLAATKTIIIDLLGTGAAAVDLTITITYHSAVDGGYLVS